jgi:hypothetical protein
MNILLMDPLRHTAGEPMLDVLAWLDAQQKMERPGK